MDPANFTREQLVGFFEQIAQRFRKAESREADLIEDLLRTFEELIVRLGTLTMILVKQGVIDAHVWVEVEREYRATLAVDQALDAETKENIERIKRHLRALRGQDPESPTE